MQTTATPTTTSASAGCSNKNITYYVQNHDDIVTVWITPDTLTQLPVGSFMYNVSGCALSVNIIRVGELTFYAEYVIVCTWCVCVCYIYIYEIYDILIYIYMLYICTVSQYMHCTYFATKPHRPPNSPTASKRFRGSFGYSIYSSI